MCAIVRACVLLSVLLCVHLCVRSCSFACVLFCVRACVRACARACVRAVVRARLREHTAATSCTHNNSPLCSQDVCSAPELHWNEPLFSQCFGFTRCLRTGKRRVRAAKSVVLAVLEGMLGNGKRTTLLQLPVTKRYFGARADVDVGLSCD